MQRRELLLGAVALAGFAGTSASAGVGTPYAPGLVDRELKAGNTVFLDFTASWCSTCKAQERVINQLMSENPAYADAITFIYVDWDEFRRAEITQRLKVPRRSTLIVLKGDEELGRIVAGTGSGQIKGLMDTALAAAT